MPVTSQQFTAFNEMKTPADLATLLGTTERRLSFLLYNGPIPYRQFTIPKANGGDRHISAPTKVIATWQRMLLDCMASMYVPTRAVHGFAPDRSVVTNAQTHVGRWLVLNFDLENFFPTIHF